MSEGLLDVSVRDYYNKTLRPFLKNYTKKYYTDLILNNTINSFINHADSCLAKKGFSHDELEEYYLPLFETIIDPNYLRNETMKKATEEEKELIKTMIDKFDAFSTIIKAEPVEQIEETKHKERLDYVKPNGDIQGFNKSSTTIKERAVNKDRLPNSRIADRKYAY